MPLFKDLDRELLVEIALRMSSLAVAPHELVYRKGDMCDRIFVIERGLVSTRGSIMFARIMFPGQVIGDEGFLPAVRPIKSQIVSTQEGERHYAIQRRKYLAVSLTYCVLMVITKGELLPLMRKYRGSQQKLCRSLVRFVARRTCSNLADAVSRIKGRGERQNPRFSLSVWRSDLSGFDSEYMTIDYTAWILTLEDATVQKAALKIQKVFRGAMERKRLNLNLRMIKRRVRSRFDSAVTKLGTLRKGVALMNHSVPMRGNIGKVEELSTSTVVATQSPPPPASSTAATAANVAPSSVTPNNNPRERNSTTSFEEQMCGMQNLLRDLKRDIFDVKNKLEDMENGFTRVS